MARPRIAILDDDLAHLQLLAEILGSEGYAVATEADLRAGYLFVKDRRPALVILDLVQDRQPVGLEVLRALRADPATRAVAILVVSADTRVLTAHAARFRQAGIGVLDKPYDLDDLLGKVSHGVARHAAAAQPGPPRAPLSRPAPSAVGWGGERDSWPEWLALQEGPAARRRAARAPRRPG